MLKSCAAILTLLATTHAACAYEERTLEFDGQARTYLIDKTDIKNKTPLVIVLHGTGQPSAGVWQATTLPQLAIKNHFVLVAPEGIGRRWNTGQKIPENPKKPIAKDDVGFILAIIDTLDKEGIIDTKRVYVTGASNGGIMVLRLICDHPERFTGAAAIIATMPKQLSENCSDHPIPLELVLGTKDPGMLWEGSDEKEARRGYIKLSGPDSAAWWAAHNRCKPDGHSTDLPDINKTDNTTITRITYDRCQAPFVFYRINGGGHNWPRTEPDPDIDEAKIVSLRGPVNHDIDSGEIIWGFFTSLPQKGAAPESPAGASKGKPGGAGSRH